jgi:hypothetical protein
MAAALAAEIGYSLNEPGALSLLIANSNQLDLYMEEAAKARQRFLLNLGRIDEIRTYIGVQIAALKSTRGLPPSAYRWANAHCLFGAGVQVVNNLRHIHSGTPKARDAAALLEDSLSALVKRRAIVVQLIAHSSDRVQMISFLSSL